MTIDLDPELERLDLPAVPVVVGSTDTVGALGACRDLGPDLFFSDDLDDVIAAKRVCLTCPVRTDCLDEAVARGERYGIWGGHLFEEGRIVLHKRRCGRPPKVARPEDAFPEVEVPEIHRRLVRPAG